MTARRRRAALSAACAALVALFCAALAGSVEGETHRTVLVVLAAVWLAIAVWYVVSLLRTKPERTEETSTHEPA